ncbi:MAG: L-threonylcarbamoyladenylate synthase [Christensenellales bacterium]|jgi:L-threonylcarbamoyladenylate synthase
MQTRLAVPDDNAIAEAARLLQDGQVVAFPTETVYGLGANALDANAVGRIFAAKGRPSDNPLIVHVARRGDVFPLIEGDIPESAQKLMEAYWPGPMTIILRKNPALPYAVTAGLDTVGIRMPSHPVAQKLILKAQLPIAAPSANLSGRPSPTSARHVFEDMDGRIPLILDGGKCDVGLESTVIDCTTYPPRVLRPGGVTPEMIARAAGDVDVDESALRPLMEGEIARSPGVKYRHYAPKGRVTIVRGEEKAVASAICALYDEALQQGKTPYILSLRAHLPLYGGRNAFDLGLDAKDMANTLFAALRRMDSLGADAIFSEAVDEDGVGLAVMNRLDRAASFHIIDA